MISEEMNLLRRKMEKLQIQTFVVGKLNAQFDGRPTFANGKENISVGRKNFTVRGFQPQEKLFYEQN